MTFLDILYVLAFCIGARIIEAVVRIAARWTMKKFAAGKVHHPYKKIAAIVSPELHARLKAHVLLLNMTITDFILIAVTEKLKRETHG